MENSLETQLKNFINTLILKKQDPVFQDQAILKRTCSAILFKGLTSGSVYIAQKHEKKSIEGITHNGDSLILDLTHFPDLKVSEGFLWLPELDLVVMNFPKEGYQAFSSLCPICKKEASKNDCDDLRCALTQEWAFEMNQCAQESHNLFQLKVHQLEDKLSISLSGQEYLC